MCRQSVARIRHPLGSAVRTCRAPTISPSAAARIPPLAVALPAVTWCRSISGWRPPRPLPAPARARRPGARRRRRRAEHRSRAGAAGAGAPDHLERLLRRRVELQRRPRPETKAAGDRSAARISWSSRSVSTPKRPARGARIRPATSAARVLTSAASVGVVVEFLDLGDPVGMACSRSSRVARTGARRPSGRWSARSGSGWFDRNEGHASHVPASARDRHRASDPAPRT